MFRVLIADALSPAAVAIFEERGIEAHVRPGLSPAEQKAIIGDYDGLAIRSTTKVTADLLDAATRLKVVGRAGIGVDNVDIEAATEHGVVVMNTPFGNSVTTAEHALAMMMALARQLPAADRSTRAGKWEKSRFVGTELSGKTLGIIGCGNIGSIVANRAQGLKMRVIAFDPFLSPDRAQDLGIEKVELDELLARADIITLHTPLTEQTRNVLSAENLQKTKKGVRIVNCARGGLVDEAALAALIETGHVAGAALDVFAIEPARESPLFGLDDVIVTPHLGASTAEAQEKVALEIAEQMSDYLLKGAIINALNMPAVTAEEAPRLRPYMQLAEQLGSFAGQLTETGLKGREDHLRRRGGAAEYPAADADHSQGPAQPVARQRQHGERPGGRPVPRHRRHHGRDRGSRRLPHAGQRRGADRARPARSLRHADPRGSTPGRAHSRHRHRGPPRPAHALCQE
jgi:D-3-phosphoglycerate dehydrogenase / 2-oxoglutarate reductase